MRGVARGFGSARTVIFLSRIIKPRRFYPAGYCLSCKYYQNTSRRVGGVRPRARVTAAVSMCIVYMYMRCTWWTSFRYTSCKTFGFPFGGASRLDGSTLSEGHPRQLLIRPRTRHAHSRRLIGIIRRYYLEEGSHAWITAALLGRVLCFNPQLRRVYRPFFPPFVISLILLRSPLETLSKLGDHLVLNSELSRRIIKGRDMINSSKETIIYGSQMIEVQKTGIYTG